MALRCLPLIAVLLIAAGCGGSHSSAQPCQVLKIKGDRIVPTVAPYHGGRTFLLISRTTPNGPQTTSGIFMDRQGKIFFGRCRK